MSVSGGRAGRWLPGRKPAALPLPSLPRLPGQQQRSVKVSVLAAVATCAFAAGVAVGMRWGVERPPAPPTPTPAYERPVLLPQVTMVPTLPVVTVAPTLPVAGNESEHPSSAGDSPDGNCLNGKPCGTTCIAMNETCRENEPTRPPVADSTPTPPQKSHGGSVHGHTRKQGAHVQSHTRQAPRHHRKKATPQPR